MVERMINVKRNYRFSAGSRKLEVVHKENSATVPKKIKSIDHTSCKIYATDFIHLLERHPLKLS